MWLSHQDGEAIQAHIQFEAGCNQLAMILPYSLGRIRDAVKQVTVMTRPHSMVIDMPAHLMQLLRARMVPKPLSHSAWCRDRCLPLFCGELGAWEYMFKEEEARKVAAGMQMFYGEGREWRVKEIAPPCPGYIVVAGHYALHDFVSTKHVIWLLEGENEENTEAAYGWIMNLTGLVKKEEGNGSADT